jgi:hypothetical protein
MTFTASHLVIEADPQIATVIRMADEQEVANWWINGCGTKIVVQVPTRTPGLGHALQVLHDLSDSRIPNWSVVSGGGCY